MERVSQAAVESGSSGRDVSEVGVDEGDVRPYVKALVGVLVPEAHVGEVDDPHGLCFVSSSGVGTQHAHKAVSITTAS
jgi:hypothetical protein